MKKTLLVLASLLFLASLTVPTTLRADEVPPACTPDGCTKPGTALAIVLNR